jgi:hypothetical protein
MTIKELNELPEDEQEDFSNTCAKLKLKTEEFRVYVEEHFPIKGIGHIKRIAHIQRIVNKKGKKYPAGTGTSWTASFEDDLLMGIFN